MSRRHDKIAVALWDMHSKLGDAIGALTDEQLELAEALGKTGVSVLRLLAKKFESRYIIAWLRRLEEEIEEINHG